MLNKQSEVKPPPDAIEDALQTYPVRPAPRSLAPAVLARIRAVTPARPQFRLEWMDLALSLLAATMLGLGYFLWRTLTPQAALQIQMQFILLQQQLNLQTLNPFVGVGLGVAGLVCGGLVLLAANFLLAPRWRG